MAQAPTLPFVAQAAYARQRGLSQSEVFPAHRVECGPPHVFPPDDAAYFGAEPIGYDTQPVTLTIMPDVAVRGGSNLLTPPEAIIRPDLIRLESDVLPDEFYDRLVLSDEGRAARWRHTDPFDVSYLPEAAAFTDGVSFNYAHWMTEVLPRIAALVRDPAARKLPLLLDGGLHKNIMRSVALIAGPDADVRRIPPHHLVRADRLHVVSNTGYVLFKLRERPLEDLVHGVFSPPALRHTVAELKRGVGVAGGGDRPKLLLRRNSPTRQVENEDLLQAELERRGFTVVAPETLTFDEQVALYSRAKVVLGATGAALTNLIFCRPDCAIIVLMMKFRHTGYWYWRRMAAAAGAGPVLHVVGEQLEPAEDPWHPMAAHGDYRVQAKDVLDAVDAAEALTGA